MNKWMNEWMNDSSGSSMQNELDLKAWCLKKALVNVYSMNEEKGVTYDSIWG
jgi:hypothetical protein